MNLKPGMRVLDVGCGVGGPAREIATFADVHVVGVNINDFQIGRARKYTERAGLSSQVEFVKGDFMSLSALFGECSFDAGEFDSIDLFVILIFAQYMLSRPLCMPHRGKAYMGRSRRCSSQEES